MTYKLNFAINLSKIPKDQIVKTPNGHLIEVAAYFSNEADQSGNHASMTVFKGGEDVLIGTGTIIGNSKSLKSE